MQTGQSCCGEGQAQAWRRQALARGAVGLEADASHVEETDACMALNWAKFARCNSIGLRLHAATEEAVAREMPQLQVQPPLASPKTS